MVASARDHSCPTPGTPVWWRCPGSGVCPTPRTPGAPRSRDPPDPGPTRPWSMPGVARPRPGVVGHRTWEVNDFLERFKVHKLVLPASWGWRKPRGDGHPETETRDGLPNLGMADPRLGMAAHTCNGRQNVWMETNFMPMWALRRTPHHRGDNRKAPVVDFFLPGLLWVWHWTNPHVARSH